MSFFWGGAVMKGTREWNRTCQVQHTSQCYTRLSWSGKDCVLVFGTVWIWVGGHVSVYVSSFCFCCCEENKTKNKRIRGQAR